MSQTLALLLFVATQVVVQPDGATITFKGGTTGHLRGGGEDYSYFLTLAQRSVDRRHPVAVSLTGQGEIVGMARANNDFVRALQDGGARVEVFFMGHDGIHFLRKDHPRFSQLSASLHAAADQKRRVWFVAKLPELVLLDLQIEP